MLYKIYSLLRDLVTVKVPEEYRKEFETSVTETNLNRAKLTTIAFIAIETMQLMASVISGRDLFSTKPEFYYGAMYISMLAAMVVFLLVFFRLDKNIPQKRTSILISGIVFAIFILVWRGGISLLDQLSSGQIVVYSIAIICVAVTPFFRPTMLLSIYAVSHAIFLILMPQKATVEEFIRAADNAQYEAKKENRNSITSA